MPGQVTMGGNVSAGARGRTEVLMVLAEYERHPVEARPQKADGCLGRKGFEPTIRRTYVVWCARRPAAPEVSTFRCESIGSVREYAVAPSVRFIQFPPATLVSLMLILSNLTDINVQGRQISKLPSFIFPSSTSGG